MSFPFLRTWSPPLFASKTIDLKQTTALTVGVVFVFLRCFHISGNHHQVDRVNTIAL